MGILDLIRDLILLCIQILGNEMKKVYIDKLLTNLIFFTRYIYLDAVIPKTQKFCVARIANCIGRIRIISVRYAPIQTPE